MQTQEQSQVLNWLVKSGSTVAHHSTTDTEIEGSYPAAVRHDEIVSGQKKFQTD